MTICCYYEFDREVVEWFRSAGSEVVLLKLTRDRQKFTILTIWRLIRRLFTIFRDIQPDIVHVQYLAPGLIPIITARLAVTCKVIATVHTAGSYAYGTKARVLLRIASFFCDRFICVSRGVEEFWFGSSQIFGPADVNSSRKHFTVYNGIDTIAIAQAVRTTDRAKIKKDLNIEGRFVIGIVGTLVELKGHTILMDAMTQIVKKFPDVILLVIGEGPERQKLIEKTASLKLNKNILWLGAQPQNKVFEFYSIMDIFVMPSLYEGFGLTAAEAMAAGLSVVGAGNIGLSEVVEDGVTGILVPPGDSDALCMSILNFMQNPGKAKPYGKNGSKRAERLYSLENFSRSMQGIYKSI